MDTHTTFPLEQVKGELGSVKAGDQRIAWAELYIGRSSLHLYKQEEP